MQVELRIKELLEAIKMLRHTTTRKTMIPALELVKLEVDGNRNLGLMTTTLEVWHERFLTPVSGRLDEPVLVSFDQLGKLVKGLKSETVTISCEPLPEKKTRMVPAPGTYIDGKPPTEEKEYYENVSPVRISGGKRGGEIPRTPLEESGFPSPPDTWTMKENGSWFGIDLSDLVSPITHVIAKDDTRYGINGLYLEPQPGGDLGAVATDGHCLGVSRADLDLEDAPEGFLLPRTVAEKIPQITSGLVNVLWAGNFVRISENQYCIHTRVIEGDFPDWRSIVRKIRGEDVNVKVDVKELADALKFLGSFAPNEENFTTFVVGTDLNLIVDNPDKGTFHATIEGYMRNVGSSAIVSLNHRYVLRALKHIPQDEKVEIWFGGHEKVITVYRDSETYELIMPMVSHGSWNCEDDDVPPTDSGEDEMFVPLKVREGIWVVGKFTLVMDTRGGPAWQLEKTIGNFRSSREECLASMNPPEEEAPW